jgi:hypothetical protein
MSDDLARARARKAAEGWLRTAEPDRVNPAEGVEAERLMWAFQAGYLMCICEDVLAGDQLLLTAQVLDAASRGGPLTSSDMERAAKTIYAARDELALERATGQRQLDDATALMGEAVDQFRSYERHHMAKVSSIFPVAETSANADTIKKANANALMAMRLEAWLAGKDQYPTSFEREHPPGYFTRIELPRKWDGRSSTLENEQALGIEEFARRSGHPGFHEGGYVKEGPMLREGEIPAVLSPGGPLVPGNAADIARQIGEAMVDGVTIKGVDHESFDRAAAYLDQPVEISAIMAPPLAEATLTMAKDAPAQSLADVRRHWAEGAGFKYWEGGEGPPADLDEDGEVMIDWGEQTESGPRFTMCGVAELTPMPGLWAETIDPDSFGTIIGYHADPTLRPASKVIEFKEPISTPPTRVEGRAEYPTPADAASDGKSPRAMIAAEPDPLAALVHARNWLISAESLIAEASAFIRGVTGANPGSDSADLCQRLDAWLTPMATRPADEGAEKEARRSSTTKGEQL